METVRNATEALRRQQFARVVTAELDVLRNDPAAWKEYLAEADSTSAADGIG